MITLNNVNRSSYKSAFEDLFKIVNSSGTHKFVRCEYVMYVFEGVIFKVTGHEYRPSFNCPYFQGKVLPELNKLIAQFAGLIDAASDTEIFTSNLYYFGLALFSGALGGEKDSNTPTLDVYSYYLGSINTVFNDLEVAQSKTGTVADKNQKIILFRKQQIVKGFVQNLTKMINVTITEDSPWNSEGELAV